MNKKELIKYVVERSGLSISKVMVAVNAFLDAISNNLAEDRTVRLQRFGKWLVRTRPSRKKYNIGTHRVEILPAKRIVAFSPSKFLLKQVTNSVHPKTMVEITPKSILLPLQNPTGVRIRKNRKGEQKKSLPRRTVTIAHTGVKLDVGTPNLGLRVRIPQTIETGDLLYCGKTSYYEAESAETEIYLYPVLLVPFFDTPILDYRTNRYSTGGVMEPVLINALNEISTIEPEIQILQNISIPINNRTYGYKPDIAIIWREKNIFIDIEIDEPYDLISRTPIHYKGCSDSLRNAYFLDNGWNVVRIAEKQIVDNCPSVVEYIKLCIYYLAEDIRFKTNSSIDRVNRWTYSEALEWAKNGYREAYLGIKKIIIPKTKTNEDFDITEFSDFQNGGKSKLVMIKPGKDIIADRYDEIRKHIIQKCNQGKYIVFSVKAKCYEYVTLANKISFEQKDASYGVELFDVIEERTIYLRFQEIASFHSLNSITKYEAVDDDDWGKILYEAILNSNPVEIEYDTAGKGNIRRRTILFVTFWYQFFNEDDNPQKYTAKQLLEIAASLKYKTLAECSSIQYISGYCNYRQSLRTFNVRRIKGGKVFACRKNLHKISVSDIWEILSNGYAEIAIQMYNELCEHEQQYLFHLGNYAHILVMQGKIDLAVSIYNSVFADKQMPYSTMTWKEACLNDFAFFMANNIKKEEFKNVQSIMKNKGW